MKGLAFLTVTLCVGVTSLLILSLHFDTTDKIKRIPEAFETSSIRLWQKTGRHIQYDYVDKAGLNDRMSLITWLKTMCAIYKATCHLKGGRYSAQHWLTSKHSPIVSPDFGRYFDLEQTPFLQQNGLHSSTNCTSITDPNTDFTNLTWRETDGTFECMTISRLMYGSKHRKDVYQVQPFTTIPFSRVIKQTANTTMAALALKPRAFKAIHIRRGDRLSTNANCTTVDRVIAIFKEETQQNDSMATTRSPQPWLVLYSATDTYVSNLKRRIDEEFGNGTRFVFEDAFQIAGENGDTYFRFAVLKEMARVSSQFIQAVC